MSRLIVWVLLGTVLLSPLPFGSIYPSAYTVFAAIVAVLVGLWGLHVAVSGTTPAFPVRRIWFPLVSFAIVIGWAIVQMSPCTPASLHNPEWADTARILG